jgi:hypothetical protein
MQTGVANMLRLHELNAVVRHLTGRGFQALVLKGPPLAQALYGDISLRPMSDLDLLVRREQVSSARAALTELGYIWPHEELVPGARVEFETEMALEREDLQRGMRHWCDLHWHLVDSPFYQRTIQLYWFWQTATRYPLGEGHVLTLALEARLLYLCAHAALHHQGGRVLWICDIDRLLRQNASLLDWGLFQEKAIAYRLPLAVQAVLLRAQEWLGTPLPEGLMSTLAALPPDPEAADVLDTRAGPPPDIMAGFVDDLGRLPGWRTKLRFFLVNAFPSPAYMHQRYAIRRRWMMPGYYVSRLAAGFWDWLRLLLGHG